MIRVRSMKKIVALALGFTGPLAMAAPKISLTDVIDDANATRRVPAPMSWALTYDQAAQKIDGGKVMALKIYESVYSGLSGREERELIATTHDSLGSADVVFPQEGEDFQACAARQGVIAFVKRDYDGRIYVCNRAAYDANRPVKYLAQVMVHESFHTVGVHDECRTTELEVEVMRRSPVGLVFRNGYWGPCGIE